MNDLQIFNSEEFGKIRTAVVNDEPMFCLADVCNALEIKNPTMTAQRLDKDERTKLNLGRQGETNFITESGLYAVILRSDKPNAKKFRKWVTSEVLPSIRKNGGYIANQENLSDAELMAKAILVAQKTIEHKNQIIEQQKQKIEADKPKTIFADAVSASKSSILVGDLAKLICQNGYQIGQKRLFQWLRDNGFLIKGGSSRNMPMQRYVEQGLFEVKESNVQNPDGSVRITCTTKVTGRGQVYFINKFMQAKVCD